MANERKPLLYEGDIVIFEGAILRLLNKIFGTARPATRVKLLGVTETPEGKELRVRKVENDTQKTPQN